MVDEAKLNRALIAYRATLTAELQQEQAELELEKALEDMELWPDTKAAYDQGTEKIDEEFGPRFDTLRIEKDAWLAQTMGQSQRGYEGNT